MIVSLRTKAIVSKSFFIEARVLGAAITDSSTNTTVGTLPDGILSQALADAATQGVFFPIQVPLDYVPATAITYNIYWTPSATDGSAHAVRWSTDVLGALVAGSTVSSAGTTTAWTGTASAKTADQVQIETAQTLVASATAGDIIRTDIRRLGADGADDYVGAVRVIGVKINYTGRL